MASIRTSLQLPADSLAELQSWCKLRAEIAAATVQSSPGGLRNSLLIHRVLVSLPTGYLRKISMKKLVLGLVLAIVLGSVLIFFMKPELAFNALPFLWGGYHKKAITERTTTLVDDLNRDNMEGCLALTDPAFLRQHGENRAKIHFGIMRTLMKVGNLKPEDVRVDDVVLSGDAKSAEVKMSVRAAGQWKAIEPYRWVRVDGKWYLTF
jgi:hypothetical protein